jgi:hypothetical protein
VIETTRCVISLFHLSQSPGFPAAAVLIRGEMLVRVLQDIVRLRQIKGRWVCLRGPGCGSVESSFCPSYAAMLCWGLLSSPSPIACPSSVWRFGEREKKASGSKSKVESGGNAITQGYTGRRHAQSISFYRVTASSSRLLMPPSCCPPCVQAGTRCA